MKKVNLLFLSLMVVSQVTSSSANEDESNQFSNKAASGSKAVVFRDTNVSWPAPSQDVPNSSANEAESVTSNDLFIQGGEGVTFPGINFSWQNPQSGCSLKFSMFKNSHVGPGSSIVVNNLCVASHVHVKSENKKGSSDIDKEDFSD